jgi:hypothetical protein
MLYKNMCAACGVKINAITETEVDYSTNFAASGGREVKISNEEADHIEQANIAALHSMKKLSLVLDLDNVGQHATTTTTTVTTATTCSIAILIIRCQLSHKT